jgi:hypothetical protein
LAFDGNNDFVELAETTATMGAGWEDTKSVELWVLPLGPGPSCQYETPAWCDAVFGDRARWWGISRGVIGGQDSMWLWNTDGSPGSSIDIVEVPYTSGEWVHITLVHQNGILSAYKNGIEVGSTPSGTTLQPNTGAKPVLHLGGIINTTSRVWTFQGQLDEVRIWNIARTPMEVQENLYQTLVGNEPGLKAYYQMSDGVGLVLTDDSQFTWNGLLYDGARGVPPDGFPPQWVPSTAFGGSGVTPTPLPPTPTFTPAPPTNTPLPPTATNTPLPPTATFTPAPPTNTPLPPTATNTPDPNQSPTPTATATSASTNYALTFDGTSHYVTLNTATNLFGSTSWTTTKSFSAWILPDPNASPAPATSPAGGEVVLGSDGPRTFGISRAIFNGLDRLWVWHADANGVDLIPVDYTPGTWLHIAAVHANNTLSVYVNGVFLNAVTSGASASTSGTVYLGGSGRSSASTYFHGQIDEVRLWNTALDEATIAAWFNQEITAAHPFFANLTAYYRMSNGSGLVLNDDSGFNHPGSLLGGMSDASWTLSTAFGGGG